MTAFLFDSSTQWISPTSPAVYRVRNYYQSGTNGKDMPTNSFFAHNDDHSPLFRAAKQNDLVAVMYGIYSHLWGFEKYPTAEALTAFADATRGAIAGGHVAVLGFLNSHYALSSHDEILGWFATYSSVEMAARILAPLEKEYYSDKQLSALLAVLDANEKLLTLSEWESVVRFVDLATEALHYYGVRENIAMYKKVFWMLIHRARMLHQSVGFALGVTKGPCSFFRTCLLAQK